MSFDANHRWPGARCAAVGFGIYLTMDVAHWALRGWRGREAIEAYILFPIYLATFLLVAVLIALRTPRHPVLASAALSGLAVFAWNLAKIPLTLFLSGLILRDHDRWASGAATEGAMLACIAMGVATVLATGVRMFTQRHRGQCAPAGSR